MHTVTWGHSPDEFAPAEGNRYHLVADSRHEGPSFLFPKGIPAEAATVRYYIKPEACQDRGSGYHRQAIRWTIRVIAEIGAPSVQCRLRCEAAPGGRNSPERRWHRRLGPWWWLIDADAIESAPAVDPPEVSDYDHSYDHYFLPPRKIALEALQD